MDFLNKIAEFMTTGLAADEQVLKEQEELKSAKSQVVEKIQDNVSILVLFLWLSICVYTLELSCNTHCIFYFLFYNDFLKIIVEEKGIDVCGN